MPVLLVIDDEPNVRFSIAQVFAGGTVTTFEADSAEEGLRLARDEAPDVILLDIRLGTRSGIDVFHELRQIDPKSLVVFITGHGTAETAIEAMRLGAIDYLVKPLDAERLRQVVNQAFEISRLMHVPALIEEPDRPTDNPDRLIGKSPAMQTVCKQIGRIAPQDINVLILGESGTGKELAARAIYHHSHRNQAPFLAINCAAIPESLLESELFGHERGAFTGADHRRIGKFEQCNGGTLFLDEVGDMSSVTQSKILRVVQEGHFERVGSNETLSSDVRIVAATNQNLETLIQQGRFRKDLFYRLRGVSLHLPPLRERREDIPELAHYFLFRFNRPLGASVHSISEAALDILQQYDWPGNVRELQSVIRECLITSAGPAILPESLPVELRRDETAESFVAEVPKLTDDEWTSLPRLVEGLMSGGGTCIYRSALDQFDRLLLSRVMRQTEGNQALAAEMLGISRPTLRSKLRTLGLSVQKSLVSNEAP
jgi:two-component system nitrogen regulation response regulator GlnG